MYFFLVTGWYFALKIKIKKAFPMKSVAFYEYGVFIRKNDAPMGL